jgi:glycogen debranching enzyme
MPRYLVLFALSICLSSGLFAGDWTLTTQPVGDRQFLAQPGERAIIQGYAGHGLEAWIYPFQLLRNYHVSIVKDGGALMPLASLLTKTSVRPESVERLYTGQDFQLTEHWFVPRAKAGIAIGYRLTGMRRLRIQVAFEPVLDLMWPGGIGGQESAWDAKLNAFDIHETTDQFHAYVGSPQAEGHSDPSSYAEPWKEHRELSLTVPLSPGGDAATVQMTLTIHGRYDGISEYKTLLHDRQQEEASTRAEYEERLARMVDLQTPDKEVNRAFRWSEVALEQAWVCNPYLGCGLIGGYGPSRDTRRPQYDWFFGGDGLTATDGLNAAGDHDRVKEEFAFLRRYQDQKNGMMWHEISQSAGLLDWSKYPFQFRHVDISMDYVQTAATVWKMSADRQWLAENWPSIQAAYRYSLSVCDPTSGLPLIPAGMQGQNEQLVLHDELSLSMGMLMAEQGYAILAEAEGEHRESQQARQAAAKLQAVIRQRYWDTKSGFVYQGFTSSGAPVVQSKAPVDALSREAFSEEQQNTLIKRLLQPDFLTAWGIRSTPSSDSSYNPSSYATGSVWAIANAAATVALWSHGYDGPAFSIWRNLAAATTMDAPGHLDEVFSGEEFRPLNVSVPEQTWSSAGFVSATVRGLLGYQGNGLTRVVALAPKLPPSWNMLSAKHLPFGKNTVDVSVALNGKQIALELTANGTGQPELPAKYSVALEVQCGAPRATANGHAVAITTRLLNGRRIGTVEGPWGNSGTVRLQVGCDAAERP